MGHQCGQFGLCAVRAQHISSAPQSLPVGIACEGGILSCANLGGDNPACPVVGQIIDAVVAVLGPDIQESPCSRTLVYRSVSTLTTSYIPANPSAEAETSDRTK